MAFRALWTLFAVGLDGDYMIIERESSLNYVTKNLYGKKDKIPEMFKLTFWVTTITSLLLLVRSKAYVLTGIYCALSLLFLLLPKYLSKRHNYILGDSLKWALIVLMLALTSFSLYIFGCEFLGEIEYSSLFWIIPIVLAISLFALYFGMRRISKTTKVSKTLLASASGGLSILFCVVVAFVSKKLLAHIPLVVTSAVLSCLMTSCFFYQVIPLLYAVIKYKFTWDDIDALGDSLK